MRKWPSNRPHSRGGFSNIRAAQITDVLLLGVNFFIYPPSTGHHLLSISRRMGGLASPVPACLSAAIFVIFVPNKPKQIDFGPNYPHRRIGT